VVEEVVEAERAAVAQVVAGPGTDTMVLHMDSFDIRRDNCYTHRDSSHIRRDRSHR